MLNKESPCKITENVIEIRITIGCANLFFHHFDDQHYSGNSFFCDVGRPLAIILLAPCFLYV